MPVKEIYIVASDQEYSEYDDLDMAKERIKTLVEADASLHDICLYKAIPVEFGIEINTL